MSLRKLYSKIYIYNSYIPLVPRQVTREVLWIEFISWISCFGLTGGCNFHKSTLYVHNETADVTADVVDTIHILKIQYNI